VMDWIREKRTGNRRCNEESIVETAHKRKVSGAHCTTCDSISTHSYTRTHIHKCM
jgi:hypothetical protein